MFANVNSRSFVRATRTKICILSLTVLFSGCVLTPTWKKLAADGSLDSFRIETERFQHLVLTNRIPGSHLRIYVEGDGTPWIRHSRISVDPTPSNPVLLELMHDSTHAAAYLGRPCYFGSATTRGCSSRWWTFERYGDVVVESMCAAANELTVTLDADTVQLIGYSGGGAIVASMVDCTERLVSIATISANLDPASWANHHSYTPLPDLTRLGGTKPSAKAVHEAHWQCRSDQIVPPSVTDAYFAARPYATRIIVDDCSHSTGWAQYWPRIIAYSSAN